MAEDDVDDIFKDFEHKVEDKKETIKHHTHHEKHHEKELSEDELIKERYRKAEHVLKDKYKKEKEVLEKKRAEEMLKHGKIPQKLPNIERIAYIAIIAVLVIFIIVDLAFYHGKDVDVESEQPISVTVGEDNESDETTTTTTTTLSEEEELDLSGEVTLTIDKIYDDISLTSNETGYITKIVFTIDNGKDKVLTPVLEVFAYDEENKEDYETQKRGEYTYGIGIKPGDTHTGSVDLVPKTWSNLHLEKNIRLTLNDTEDGFITAAHEEVIIS